MKKKKLIINLIISSVILLVIIFKVNEKLVFMSIDECSWPQYHTKEQNQIKVMFISDIHLRTNTLSTLIDNSLREWQMYSAFNYAKNHFRPEYVFILGDVFDDGERIDDHKFQTHVNRLKQMFSVDIPPKNSSPIVYVINGNHDIGFHYTMTQRLKSRFDRSFQTDSVKLIQIKDINIVTINSVTMEGDYCHLCSEAEQKLMKISDKLFPKNRSHSGGQGPILLTHFPLFRHSDSQCGFELDSTPESIKYIPFKEKWDCLSENSTKLILKSLQPKLVITGHTHYGCVTRHPHNLYEWTVSSFSYRNTYNPTILLAKISKNNYSISKCILINEFIFYLIDFHIILFFIFIWKKLLIKKSYVLRL